MRWSIAGCTCNFKMNITHFISVVFGKTSLNLITQYTEDKGLAKNLSYPFFPASKHSMFPSAY